MKWHRVAPLFTVFLFLNAQTPALRDAISAMERGEFQAAERSLRKEVAAHPDDALALSLLGAALDNLNQPAEAAGFHRRALAIAPASADILNSYAAHLMVAGDEQEARKVYLRVIAVDAANRVANLQLARLAVKNRDSPEALRSLDRLQPRDRESSPALLLQMQAFYLGGDTAHADQLFAQLSELTSKDLNLSSAAVNALSSVRQYGRAETICENALKAWPSNFKVLYSLGVVAAYAGHYDRAREVLETALARQPRNIDVLYALARLNAAQRQWEAAVGLLAQAGKLDPRRADVQRLLAVATTELGALDDAAAAWDRYLNLDPQDEEARRERSYTDVQRGELENGIAGLEAYAARHPADAIGHYELGQAQSTLDQAKALANFDRALEIDPNYVEARTARGSLLYQAGKLDAAVRDLEIAASLRPDDAATLDRLGQAYASLDRTDDAVRVLRRAAAIAPDDSKILLHFGRALAEAGSNEESKAVLARFRDAGSEKPRALPSGLVDYLSLTEAQRRADYRARVEKEVRDHPQDAAARLAWLKLVIENSEWDVLAPAVRSLAALQPKPAVLAEAGSALVAAKQYSLALEIMEPIPEAGRAADYYLARAEMLAAAGKTEEIRTALDQALRNAPADLNFYLQATVLLVRLDRLADALHLLDQGARLLPGNRQVLLLQAEVSELAGQSSEAARLLTDIQSRWPEWFPAWVVHGVILKSHQHPEDARRAFQTASELGAPAEILGLDLKALIAGSLVAPVQAAEK